MAKAIPRRTSPKQTEKLTFRIDYRASSIYHRLAAVHFARSYVVFYQHQSKLCVFLGFIVKIAYIAKFVYVKMD